MEIYSNCTGSFVIENKKVIDRMLFADPIVSNGLLDRGEETPEEQALLKKHSGAKIQKIRNIDEVILTANLQDMRKICISVVKNKMRHSVHDDLLIIQTISNMEDLDKTINLLSKRLREWYELYNPEFSRAMPSHEMFVQKILTNSKKDLLEQINAKETMGADLPKKDVDAMMNLAKQIKELFALKEKQLEYLATLMNSCCPNVTKISGVPIGAKLISLAGSLDRLSSFPASTVQLLGAEKALFRHLRNKKNRSPKYGILHEHPFVLKVAGKNKGKMARTIADKISIAAKIDVFKGKYFGDDLLKQVEKKMEQLK